MKLKINKKRRLYRNRLNNHRRSARFMNAMQNNHKITKVK